MRISCEKCKTLFKIQDKDLSSKGATILCPKCSHPHLVKRVVIPYGDLKYKEELEKSICKNETALSTQSMTVKSENAPKDETLIRKLSKKAGLTTKEILKSVTDNPFIEKLEKKILSKVEIEKDKNQIENDIFKIDLETKNINNTIIKPAIVPKINDATDKTILPNHNIVSYSDIQKLATHSKKKENSTPFFSSFLISILLITITIFLVLFMFIIIWLWVS